MQVYRFPPDKKNGNPLCAHPHLNKLPIYGRTKESPNLLLCICF